MRSAIPSSAIPIRSVAAKLMWPEDLPLDVAARQQAENHIAGAGVAGLIDDHAAARRRARLDRARTRRDLRHVLDGLPGSVAPTRLVLALRLTTAISILTVAVDFVVWAMVTV